MPQSTQNDVEKFLIREFLAHLGVQADNIDATRERPDARIECFIDGQRKIIGLDVTEYQVDTQDQGGSRAQALESAWNRIWDRIQSESFPKYAQLHQIGVQIFFDKQNPPRTRQADQIADELSQFLVSVSDRINEEGLFFRRSAGDFDGWNLLKACTEKLRAYRYAPARKGPSLWQRSDAAHVGIVSEVLTRILAKKRKARRGYNLAGADEYWLLIAAGAGVSSSCAGPQWHCSDELRSQPIRDAASEAGFDRVYFWERASQWCEMVYPCNAVAIEVPQSVLAEFCRQHHIQRMALFGSVLRDDFSDESDIDVLVEFEPGHVPGLQFFGMQEELSALLGRRVDLNTLGFFRSPLRERIAEEAEVVYGPTE